MAPSNEGIQLPSVPLVYEYKGGENIYVRECYDEYFKIIEKPLLVDSMRCVTVTGTPGACA